MIRITNRNPSTAIPNAADFKYSEAPAALSSRTLNNLTICFDVQVTASPVSNSTIPALSLTPNLKGDTPFLKRYVI